MLRGVRIPTSRPPSWRTHSITMRVGPGGGAHVLHFDRANGRPVPSGRNRHVKGSLALGLSASLCRPPGLALSRGVEVMEEM